MSRVTVTTGDCAEQAGHAIASNCLDAMLKSDSQAENGKALQTALLELQRLPHPKRAAGGFTMALVNVLEVGLMNLPKGA
ncbi:MAG: hypothetical protein Q8K22_08440 [Rhodoferax sp.]|nr:hypothetical protein [Rhodoferax sp.]